MTQRWVVVVMKTLHIVPGDSAAGSLRRAVQDAGRDDEVLAFRDDLSCGPIDPDDPAIRGAWWELCIDAAEVEQHLRAFWSRVDAGDDRLVLWYGRHSARELAFVLASADRLPERPYRVIDVTGRDVPTKQRDGTIVMKPAKYAAIVRPDGLRNLFDTERTASAREIDEWRATWRQLRSENAPFRVVTDAGLVSAPLDHFDALLLEQTRDNWRSIARVVGETLGHTCEPHWQVGDLMLLARVAALVGDGKLIAEGDPWDMRSRVRLPG